MAKTPPSPDAETTAPPLAKLKAFNDVHDVVVKLSRADQIEVLGAIARFFGIAASVELAK